MGLTKTPPYKGIATVSNASQAISINGSKVTLWGVPADPAHDAERGGPAGVPEKPFLTLPRSCTGPLETVFSGDSWQHPGAFATQAAPSAGLGGCAGLDFGPDPAAAPTTTTAESPSGFDFSVDVDDPGLIDPDGSAETEIKKAVVTLPEGLAVNPAAAHGLDACSPAQLEAESASSAFGAGCPAGSRVASLEIESPLLPNDVLGGSIFLATPYQNPFGSLLAGYLVAKSPERGIAIKIPGRIEADPRSGQLVASFDDNPQLPFSHLEVHFKSGPHAALITPPTCGTYEIETELFPWSGNPSTLHTDPFSIDRSPSGGSCAAGDPGAPANSAEAAKLPNAPTFDAGTVSPIAGAYSPFVVQPAPRRRLPAVLRDHPDPAAGA